MQIKEDYIKIGKKASKYFRKFLSEDEIQSCIYMGIVLAFKKHCDKKSKLTTYIYNYVRWECLEQIKFNTKYVNDFNFGNIAIEEKEHSEELFNEILYDKLLHGLNFNDLAKKYNKDKKEIIEEFNNKIESFKKVVSINEQHSF